METIESRYSPCIVFYAEDGSQLESLIDRMPRLQPVANAVYRWNDDNYHRNLGYRVAENEEGNIVLVVFSATSDPTDLIDFLHKRKPKCPDFGMTYGLDTQE